MIWVNAIGMRLFHLEKVALIKLQTYNFMKNKNSDVAFKKDFKDISLKKYKMLKLDRKFIT